MAKRLMSPAVWSGLGAGGLVFAGALAMGMYGGSGIITAFLLFGTVVTALILLLVSLVLSVLFSRGKSAANKKDAAFFSVVVRFLGSFIAGICFVLVLLFAIVPMLLRFVR